MTVLKTVLMLAMTLVLASGAVAEDAKKGEKRKAGATKKEGDAKKGEGAKRRGVRKAPSVTSRFTAKLDLSAEQKEKYEQLGNFFNIPPSYGMYGIMGRKQCR